MSEEKYEHFKKIDLDPHSCESELSRDLRKTLRNICQTKRKIREYDSSPNSTLGGMAVGFYTSINTSVFLAVGCSITAEMAPGFLNFDQVLIAGPAIVIATGVTMTLVRLFHDSQNMPERPSKSERLLEENERYEFLVKLQSQIDGWNNQIRSLNIAIDLMNHGHHPSEDVTPLLEEAHEIRAKIINQAKLAEHFLEYGDLDGERNDKTYCGHGLQEIGKTPEAHEINNWFTEYGHHPYLGMSIIKKITTDHASFNKPVHDQASMGNLTLVNPIEDEDVQLVREAVDEATEQPTHAATVAAIKAL